MMGIKDRKKPYIAGAKPELDAVYKSGCHKLPAESPEACAQNCNLTLKAIGWLCCNPVSGGFCGQGVPK